MAGADFFDEPLKNHTKTPVELHWHLTIKSPPELIWDVITNLRQAKEWAPGFDDYPYISPEWPALGAKAVWRYHAGLFSFDFELTITESFAATHCKSRTAVCWAVEWKSSALKKIGTSRLSITRQAMHRVGSDTWPCPS